MHQPLRLILLGPRALVHLGTRQRTMHLPISAGGTRLCPFEEHLLLLLFYALVHLWRLATRMISGSGRPEHRLESLHKFLRVN